jgi:addiction module HigA family antidote
MLPENRIPTHPGEVLLEEFLNPMELSQVAFAEHIGVPVQRVNEIVRGNAVLLRRLPGYLHRHSVHRRNSG